MCNVKFLITVSCESTGLSYAENSLHGVVFEDSKFFFIKDFRGPEYEDWVSSFPKDCLD